MISAPEVLLNEFHVVSVLDEILGFTLPLDVLHLSVPTNAGPTVMLTLPLLESACNGPGLSGVSTISIEPLEVSAFALPETRISFTLPLDVSAFTSPAWSSTRIDPLEESSKIMPDVPNARSEPLLLWIFAPSH